MSELPSQRLPNCSVKPLAGGGERSGEGDVERASGEEEKVHMAQAAALSTHAAWPATGSLQPRWKRLLPDSIPESKPCSSSRCWWPRAPACCAALCNLRNTLRRSPEGHKPTDARVRPGQLRRCCHRHPCQRQAGRCRAACGTSAQA